MRTYKALLTWACVALGIAAGLATAARAEETKGPVTDALGVIVIPKGAPIQLGELLRAIGSR